MGGRLPADTPIYDSSINHYTLALISAQHRPLRVAAKVAVNTAVQLPEACENRSKTAGANAFILQQIRICRSMGVKALILEHLAVLEHNLRTKDIPLA